MHTIEFSPLFWLSHHPTFPPRTHRFLISMVAPNDYNLEQLYKDLLI